MFPPARSLFDLRQEERRARESERKLTPSRRVEFLQVLPVSLERSPTPTHPTLNLNLSLKSLDVSRGKLPTATIRMIRRIERGGESSRKRRSRGVRRLVLRVRYAGSLSPLNRKLRKRWMLTILIPRVVLLETRLVLRTSTRTETLTPPTPTPTILHLHHHQPPLQL